MNNFKVMILKLLIIVSVGTLNSCDIFDSHKLLIGRYYLNHTKFGNCICYKVDEEDDYVELIDGAIREIGFDTNYIIVEIDGYKFFIIPIYKEMNYSPEKGILGPLNTTGFNKQKRALNIKADFNIKING